MSRLIEELAASMRAKPSEREIRDDPGLHKDARELPPLSVRMRRVYDETCAVRNTTEGPDPRPFLAHDPRAFLRRVFDETRAKPVLTERSTIESISPAHGAPVGSVDDDPL